MPLSNGLEFKVLFLRDAKHFKEQELSMKVLVWKENASAELIG